MPAFTAHPVNRAAWDAAREVKPKFISRSDAAAQWTGALKGHAFFAHATNYLIDLDHTVIVDVEATRAIRQAEVGAARTMIERTQDRFGLYPSATCRRQRLRLGREPRLADARARNRAAYPVFDKSERHDGIFSRSEFVYDRKGDAYICHVGKQLKQRQRVYRMQRPLVDDDGMMRYRASKLDCDVCTLKPRCSKYACTQDPALGLRGCSRHGTSARSAAP